MSDIFSEVDEEVRREQLKRLWDRYGNVIIALAVLIVVGLAAWRGYQWYQAKLAAEASANFETAVALSEQGKREEAEAAFAKVANAGVASYRALARLREAAELAQRDPKTAVQAYDRLAGDSSLTSVLQELAALRAAALLVDTAPYDEMRRRLEPLTGADRPFRHSARQLLVLAAWRAGNVAEMRKWYDLMVTDAETPPATRSHADMLMALVAGTGKG